MTDKSAPEAPKPKKPRTKIYRPSSRAARWHMSAAAVDRDVTAYGRWTDLQCVRHLAIIRWGSFTRVTCSHCNTAAEHHWDQPQLRWKCLSCKKRFSVTSNTSLAGHRLKLQAILACIFLWASSASGKPSLEVRRMLGIRSYNTVFVILAKVREALRRGYMTGLLSGRVEIDGAHHSGHRASIKRGKPLNTPKKSDEQAVQDHLKADSEKQQRKAERDALIAAGGIPDPEHGFIYAPDRRIVMTLSQRNRSRERGSCATRVAVGRAETPEVIEAFIDRYVAVPESAMLSDSHGGYSKVGKKFALHLKVNHNKELVGPNGEHINNSEGFTSRMDRAESGIYLNLEPKYLLDYATETAFRQDHRRLSPGEIADRALHYLLNVGLSQEWRGFTHGKHRENELLLPKHQPAKASGPPKKNSEEGKKKKFVRPPR